MVAHCQTLLLRVADSIAAFVGGIVLRERVQELERTSVRESLQGMELLKAELLGTVSHELRGPLASIKGYAATLRSNTSSASLSASIASIRAWPAKRTNSGWA